MAMISTKYQDIISSSSLIQSGPPAVYQLGTKKEKFGSLTRITVGEKDVNKTSKTILLVGETRTGKSALINSLVNYSMGVKWEDEVWFHIVDEEEESQTSDVMMYQIFGFEGKTLPYSLTIIDTPGFGDTSGAEHDDNISQKLLDLFGSDDGVHEVHAVGLVMKASDNKLSDRLMYVFEAVTSLFGRGVEENIVALITHSDGMPPNNAFKALEDPNVKCSKNKKNQFVHFVFNNQQSTQRTEDNEFGLETAWRIAERGFRQFTGFLQDVKPKRPEKRSEIQTECIRLAAYLQNLRERIRFTELRQRDVKQAEEALGDYEQEMEINPLFNDCVTEVYKAMETIRAEMCRFGFEEAVTCNICKENCHYPGCTMALKPEDCEVMKNGSCTSCTRRCPASAHSKANWRYVIRTKAVQKTENIIKQKYDEDSIESKMAAELVLCVGLIF